MKKLLSILVAIGLTVTSTSSVIACRDKTKYKNLSTENQYQQDTKTLNQINQQVQKQIDTKLFNNVFNSDLDNDLEYIYNKVNKTETEYQLSWTNENDKKILLYFFNEYEKIITKINEKIITNYTNYYQNNYPISFEKEDIILKIEYFDKDKINEKKDIIENIPHLDNFKLVGLEFENKYKTNYKNLSTENQINKKSNVTNNVTLFDTINEKIIDIFQNELLNWLNNIKKLDLKKEMKKLYDDFNIDYSQNIKIIDDEFKKIFNKFVKSNIKLNSFNITFNKNINFLSKVSALFDNYEKDLFSFKGNVKLYEDIPEKYSDLFLPHTWAGKGKANELENFNLDNFLRKYKEIITAFNLEDEHELELGKFNLDLSFVNLYGLNLKGLIKINKKNFETSIILKKDDLEEKLKNFLNIIIAWYKFFNVSFEKNNYSIKITQILLNKLKYVKTKTLKNAAKIINDAFKEADNIKNMPDINIFSFENTNKIEEIAYTISDNNFNIKSSFFTTSNYIFNFIYGEESTIYYSAFFNNTGFILKIND